MMSILPISGMEIVCVWTLRREEKVKKKKNVIKN